MDSTPRKPSPPARAVDQRSADAVLGSRMLVPGAARKGGMPLYKFAGNKILTCFQNRLLGSGLSEFHSGFRAYRVAALGDPVRAQFERLPLRYGDHIQLMLAGVASRRCRFRRTTATKSAGSTASVRQGRARRHVASRLHRLNVFYDRRYDIERYTNTHYDLKLGLQVVAHGRARRGARKAGVCSTSGAAPATSPSISRRKTDGQRSGPVPPFGARAVRRFMVWKERERYLTWTCGYDYVLMLDIVEHLKDPERFLDHLPHARGAPTAGRPSSSPRAM